MKVLEKNIMPDGTKFNQRIGKKITQLLLLLLQLALTQQLKMKAALLSEMKLFAYHLIEILLTTMK